MTVVVLSALAAFVSTVLGGLCAIRLKKHTELILGFSAGTLLGLAFFDLLPVSIAHSVDTFDTLQVTSLAALGFMCYLSLDQLILSIDRETNSTTLTWRGKMMALSLTLHSFLDGIAIGVAFEASKTIGALVTTAILIHDFTDGINISYSILREKGSSNQAKPWIFVNALAPILGACSTTFLHLSKAKLGMMTALLSGIFLYMGAVQLRAKSQNSKNNGLPVYLMTLLGMGIIYVAVRITGN